MVGIGEADAFRHDWQRQVQPEICSPLTRYLIASQNSATYPLLSARALGRCPIEVATSLPTDAVFCRGQGRQLCQTSFGLVRHQPLRLVVKTSGFGIAPPSA